MSLADSIISNYHNGSFWSGLRELDDLIKVHNKPDEYISVVKELCNKDPIVAVRAIYWSDHFRWSFATYKEVINPLLDASSRCKYDFFHLLVAVAFEKNSQWAVEFLDNPKQFVWADKAIEELVSLITDYDEYSKSYLHDLLKAKDWSKPLNKYWKMLIRCKPRVWLSAALKLSGKAAAHVISVVNLNSVDILDFLIANDHAEVH